MNVVARAQPYLLRIADLFPGLLVIGTIALGATLLANSSGVPIMLVTLVLGIAFNFLAHDSRCVAGIQFSSQTLLRIGVALLGVRITIADIVSLGITPVIVTCIGICATIAAGVVFSKWLNLNRDIAILTAGAVSICGASAALALSAVMPRHPKGITELDVVVTVAGVTTLSTVAMLVYPVVAMLFGLSQEDAGIFLGASIHDVAQVVGAGYSLSSVAGNAATVTKLLRVAMLLPVLIVLPMALSEPVLKRRPRRLPLPTFLIMFVVFSLIASAGIIAPIYNDILVKVSNWMLVAAIAAIGIRTSLKNVASIGSKKLLLIVLETLFLGCLSMCLVLWA